MVAQSFQITEYQPKRVARNRFGPILQSCSSEIVNVLRRSSCLYFFLAKQDDCLSRFLTFSDSPNSVGEGLLRLLKEQTGIDVSGEELTTSLTRSGTGTQENWLRIGLKAKFSIRVLSMAKLFLFATFRSPKLRNELKVRAHRINTLLFGTTSLWMPVWPALLKSEGQSVRTRVGQRGLAGKGRGSEC